MATTINRILLYVSAMLFVILCLVYAPDVQVAGWVAGYTQIGLLVAGVYFLARYCMNYWNRVVIGAIRAGTLIRSLWERYKRDAFDNIYAMSFFIGALGVGIIALQLNGINSAVSQSFNILSPLNVNTLTILYGVICIITGLLIVIFPERRTPYYGGVGLFVAYAGFQGLNTSQRAVSGRGLLATLIVVALAYFAFKSMVNHDVALSLKERIRKSTIQQSASNKLIEKMLEGSYGDNTQSAE